MSVRTNDAEGSVAPSASMVPFPKQSVAEVDDVFCSLLDDTFSIYCRLAKLEQEMDKDATRPSRKNRTRRKSR